MKSLKDFQDDYSFTINGQPIGKVVSDALKMDVENECPSFLSDDRKLCGTISWGVSPTELQNTISVFEHFMTEHEKLMADVSKQIRDYLLKKINEFCDINHIDFIQWSRNGVEKHLKNKVEYYYKDYFICGVEIVSEELIPDQLKTEHKMWLKYY